MLYEVHQQVLRHIIAVQQSQHDLLKILLINEAILIKICKEEAVLMLKEVGSWAGNGLGEFQSPRHK